MTLRARKRRLFFGGGDNRSNILDDGSQGMYDNESHKDGSGGSGSGIPLFRRFVIGGSQNPVTKMMLSTTGKPLLALLLLIIPIGWFLAANNRPYGRIKIVDYCTQISKNQNHHHSRRQEPIWEWQYYSKKKKNNQTTTSTTFTEQNSTTTRRTVFKQESRQKLLIAQYSGHGRLLQVTSKINQQYAKIWNHDYVLVQGNILNWMMMMSEEETNLMMMEGKKKQEEEGIIIKKPSSYLEECELPYTFSHWNKLDLLQMVIDDNTNTNNNKQQQEDNNRIGKKAYDQILILDETSMLYDMERDITTLLSSSNNEILAATRIYRKRGEGNIGAPNILGSRTTRTWDFNIMLWNLHHSDTLTIVKKWKNQAIKQIDSISSNTDMYTYDDQWILHDIITSEQNYKSKIKTLEIGFTDYGGYTMIHHFNNFPVDYEGNWEQIDHAVGEVCQRNPSIMMCADLCTSNVPRRNPEWEWRYYNNNNNNNGQGNNNNTSNNKKKNSTNTDDNAATKITARKNRMKDSRKLLIAQYSAFGSYAKLLELTAPINKAYARLWHADYVVLQGASISIYPRDSWCTPPQERSRFNKISLLQLALARRKEYDLLLLLDADAMIYDFSKDLRSYLPVDSDVMLVAHRVNANEGPHSWDINNGVTLWNLQHPMTSVVVDDWYHRTLYELNRNPTTRRYMLTGDQSVLQAVLREENRKDYVYTYVNEFQYRNGTVIKHFIRENLLWDKHDVWKMTSLESRSTNIQNASNYVCNKYHPACVGIEDTPYTQL